MKNATLGNTFTGFRRGAVVKVAATGFNPYNDRIVEVVILKTDFDTLVSEKREATFETYRQKINPGILIPEEATVVHGIRDEDVSQAPGFAEVAGNIKTLLGRLPIIGHTVDFSTRFLNVEMKRANMEELKTNPCYCAVKRFRASWLEDPKCGLEDMARKILGRVREGEIHDPLEDATLTAGLACHFYGEDNARPMPKLIPKEIVLSVLNKAKDRISTPQTWTRKALARGGRGRETEPYSRGAKRWGLDGALLAAIRDVKNDPETGEGIALDGLFAQAIQPVINEGKEISDWLTAAGWNNDEKRTHAQVLQVLDEAIEYEGART